MLCWAVRAEAPAAEAPTDPLAALMEQGTGPAAALAAGDTVSKAQAMRFIKMVSVAMADQLRACAYGSIAAYQVSRKQRVV